jgi:uncharacterized membrane protein
MRASASTNISDVFLGSEQSKYAGIALFITILIICLAILFTSSKIPIEQRLVFVIFILIITIPSILMSLFELTCIVTGGNYNTRWWCWALAWVLAVMIIFYCIMIIISLFISMTNYDLANERISDDLEKNKVDNTTDNINANNYAKNIMNSYEEDENNPYHSANDYHDQHNYHDQRDQRDQRDQHDQHDQHDENEEHDHREQNEQYMRTMSQQDSSSPQYLPPMLQSKQPQIPQQSQHMNVNQQSQHMNVNQQSINGSYTGFDSSDNLSPLDTPLTYMNEVAQQQQHPNVNSHSRNNENIEAFSDDSTLFSLY